MVSAPQRAKVEAQLEAAVGAGAELLVGGDRAGFERGHFLAPAVVTGAPESTAAAARGDLRPGGADRARRLARRGDPARQRHALRARRERLHARPRDRRALHARDPGRDGLDQRPADRQRRRSLRRHEAVRLRPRARPGGPRGVPGHEARPHRDEDRAEGLVVPVRRAKPAARASATENAASSSTRTSPPPRSSTSRSANTQIARSSVATSAFFAFAITFLVGPRRPPQRLADLRVGHAGARAATPPGAPRAAGGRAGRSAGPAARRARRAARRARASP